jgi:glutamine amidotransferase
MEPIIIINYGMGNVGSIANMLKKIGKNSVISSDYNIIKNAKKLILPGVGAFDNAIKNIHNLGLFDLLNEKVLVEKVPILGICLGIQLFTKRSDEGTLNGFGWIDAETISFEKNLDKSKYKIPHMGWNTINIKKNISLIEGLNNQDTRFYFVHSYFVSCASNQDILTTTNYGIEFASSVQRDNIFGVQFHPEKSHKFGMQLLKNFVNWEC